MKSALVQFIKKNFPCLYWKLQIGRLRKNFGESEMHLLPILCQPQKTSLDIGAAGGVFLINMVNKSKRVMAFEPIPGNVKTLHTIAEMLGGDIQIESIALSDTAGETTLRMVANDLGRSTIEEENQLDDGINSKKETLAVTIKPLDDYQLTDVGFIKIDVEGHEHAVLKGARKTIEQNHPLFLIEIEERHKHNAVADIISFLAGYNYEGFFINDGSLQDIKEFSVTAHQDTNNIGDVTNHYIRSGIYINNFIFVPQQQVVAFRQQANAILQEQLVHNN